MLTVAACAAPSNESIQSRTSGGGTSNPIIFNSPDGAYSFHYPPGWTVETVNEGTLLLAPAAEGDWQTNLYFETGSDPESRDLSQALEDLASNLPASKSDFQLMGIDTVPTASSSAGRITYTHTSSGTKLLSWEVIVPSAAGTNRLFVTAATADGLKEKYIPIFEEILKSLKLSV